MKKGFNKILITLMSVALLGLIIIQVYWTQKVFVSQTEEFNGRVYQALNATVDEINQMELNYYYTRFEDVREDFKASTDKPQVMSSQMVQDRSEEHTSELQSRGHLVCRLLLEKKKK